MTDIASQTTESSIPDTARFIAHKADDADKVVVVAGATFKADAQARATAAENAAKSASAPASHSHSIASITGLQAALDALDARLDATENPSGTAPSISSNGGGATASISAVEGTTAVTTVAASGTAPITYSLSGADASAFNINSSTGVLTFASAPAYAVGGGNIRDLVATATNAHGSDSQTLTVTITQAWPSVVSFAAAPSPAPIVAMSVPALRTATLDPRMATPHVPAGTAQTRLTRISNASEFAQPLTGSTWNNFGPEYALLQHWSKDGDMMIVRALLTDSSAAEQPHAYYTALHLLNGNTYAHMGACVDASTRGLQSGVWRWSNLFNDEIVCLKVLDANFAEPKLWKFQPTTKVFSVLKDFSPTYDNHYSGFKYTGEDTQSRNGRYWALLLRKPSTQWYIVVWDRQTDSVVREWTASNDITSHNISFGLSPSGTYLWCASFGGEVIGGTTLAGGVTVFSVATGAQVSHLGAMNGATMPIGHTGSNTDSAGNEVWTWFHGEPGAALNERGLRSWRMDGSSPTTYTVQLADARFLGFEYMNQSVPGHVVVSDYPVPTNNATYNDYPLRGQIFVVPLDGSGSAKLITSSRYSTANYAALANNGYAVYPWATPNRNLSKVLFKSTLSNDWSGGLVLPAHAYVAHA